VCRLAMLGKTLLIATLAVGAIALEDLEEDRCRGPQCANRPTCEVGRLSCNEGRAIVAELSRKINLYFGAGDHEAIAELYSEDCVIVDKQTASAQFGKAGVIATNSALAKNQSMTWTTTNMVIDRAHSHFVLSGNGALYVQADNATYSGTFKQVLQQYGSEWLLIYELFDLV
ncbi:hypothetical protein PENTCL1PPCAC_12824, partial [Pristionchus entomophagus]